MPRWGTGDRDVYRWAASNSHCGSDAD
jgi:hypothetical protein